MKKQIITTIAVLAAGFAIGQTTVPKTTPAPAPTTTAQKTDPGYKFDVTYHDYGKIKKGSDPYCQFMLTNTGKEPLVISEAHGSCGCTVPEYPKEPIAPGATVVIKVKYDTNRPGVFDKTVTMNFVGKDTPAVLRIHGEVESPPAETSFPAPGNGSSNGGVPVNNQ